MDQNLQSDKRNRADKRAIRRKQLFPFAMMSPFWALTLIFVVIPIVLTIVMSFTDMGITLKWKFIGTSNYKRIFGYPQMEKILLRTLLFVAVNTVCSVLGSIIVVIITTYYLDLVYQRKNLGLMYRIIWLIPSLTPTIVFMFIWRFVFGPEEYGLINGILIKLGLEPVTWFSNYSMFLLMLSSWIRSASGSIILFSSAIIQVPENILQSAKVDGASPFKICMKIVLPYLRWPIMQKTLWTILGNFTAYESIRLLTNGGPMGSTVTYSYFIYQNAWMYNRYGYGAALSVFMVALSILFGLIMLKVFNIDKQMRKPQMDI